MSCQLCGEEKPLIQAHIIPRPFFEAFGRGKQQQKVLSNTHGVHPKKVRTGFYDTGILCERCDRRLGVWDQYGAEVFIRSLNTLVPLADTSETIAYSRREFDYHRLKLFLLSVLWRAHVSTLPMFQRVRLGPFATQLHEMIRSEQPGEPDDFACILSVFTLGGTIPERGLLLLDPHRERWNGANAYRLSFGVVTAYVKVDRASYPPSFMKLAVSPNRPLWFLERDFASSPEASIARTIARHPQNRRAFRNSQGKDDA